MSPRFSGPYGGSPRVAPAPWQGEDARRAAAGARAGRMLGRVVGRTFRILTCVEQRARGSIFRAMHLTRPEPFHLYVLDPALDSAQVMAEGRFCEVQLRANGAQGDLAGFLQQGIDSTSGQVFFAWPVSRTVPLPVDLGVDVPAKAAAKAANNNEKAGVLHPSVLHPSVLHPSVEPLGVHKLSLDDFSEKELKVIAGPDRVVQAGYALLDEADAAYEIDMLFGPGATLEPDDTLGPMPSPRELLGF